VKGRMLIIGIDVNEGTACSAWMKNTLIEWHLGSATALPFEDGTAACWTARANYVMPGT